MKSSMHPICSSMASLLLHLYLINNNIILIFYSHCFSYYILFLSFRNAWSLNILFSKSKKDERTTENFDNKILLFIEISRKKHTF